MQLVTWLFGSSMFSRVEAHPGSAGAVTRMLLLRTLRQRVQRVEAAVLVATAFLTLSVALSLPATAQADFANGTSAPPASGVGAGPNYCSQYGNTNSSYQFDNVYACATTWSNGPTPFDSNGNYSFQCVELSDRLLWAVYGIWQGKGTDGADLVSTVHSAYPNIPIGSPGPGSVPVAGDVISLGPGPAAVVDPTYGHTAVVVSSNPATGAFTIMSQNYPEGKAGEQSLQVDLSGGHNGYVSLSGSWTKASWLDLRTPTAQHASVALIANDGASGYTVDGYGHLHPFGNAPAVTSPSPLWPGWDIVRGIALFPDSTPFAVRGYVLDGWGGIHPFGAGNASPPPSPSQYAYWQGWDIARGIVLRGNTGTGYVLDGWGGLHPFAPSGVTLPATPANTAYWKGWDIARGVALATANSGYIVDGWGGIHPFGGAPTVSNPNYWSGWDIVRGITLAAPTSGYLLDGFGGIHPFGGAPAVSSPGYSSGNDIFRGIALDPSTGYGADVTDLTTTPYTWHS
jgi:hypothetical protein